MIESSLGIFTGSIYCDASIYEKGFKGEVEQVETKNTIVQKTHYGTTYAASFSYSDRFQHLSRFQGRGILVIRNIYDALKSYWSFLHGDHVAFVGFDFDDIERQLFETFVVE